MLEFTRQLQRELASAKLENARLQMELDASCNAEEMRQLQVDLSKAKEKEKMCGLCNGPTVFQFNQMADELAVAKKDFARLERLIRQTTPQRDPDISFSWETLKKPQLEQ